MSWLDALYQCIGGFHFFFASRRRHTRSLCDWSSDVCSSDLPNCDALERMNRSWGASEKTLANIRQLREADCVAVVSGQQAGLRSEERRVGKECRSRWSPYH